MSKEIVILVNPVNPVKIKSVKSAESVVYFGLEVTHFGIYLAWFGVNSARFGVLLAHFGISIYPYNPTKNRISSLKTHIEYKKNTGVPQRRHSSNY